MVFFKMHLQIYRFPDLITRLAPREKQQFFLHKFCMVALQQSKVWKSEIKESRCNDDTKKCLAKLQKNSEFCLNFCAIWVTRAHR